MSRSPIPSRLEPFGSGTQARVAGQSSVNPAAAGEPKSVKLEFDGVVQSTWKWKTRYAPPFGHSTKEFGAPAGGGGVPSRGAGREGRSGVPPGVPGGVKSAAASPR